MLDPFCKKLLQDSSKLTVEIGHKIGSPRIKANDLAQLEESLEAVQGILRIVRNTMQN